MTDLRFVMQVPPGQTPAISPEELVQIRGEWPFLSREERIMFFNGLSHGDAEDLFLSLPAQDQADLIIILPERERKLWVRLLPPDDLADVIQRADPDHRTPFLDSLDLPTRKEVVALLAYAEDEAGGLMNPRFARVRPTMTVDEAISYLRRQAPSVETVRYLYILDTDQKLLGVVSLRKLFASTGEQQICSVMRPSAISASESLSQEDLKQLFSSTGLMAIPVLNEHGQMKGIVTVDDIVSVVEEEATEDIQRLGGSEVLEGPYLRISLLSMIKKRAGWLVILFVGEMLTASAMGYYEKEIERAVVLALFIPLIISSGGNSGSQASTLVVRAIALQDVRLRDWFRVLLREVIVGTSLGVILGTIGFLRIIFWPSRVALYGEHYMLVGATVACSLVGIVLWGSLSGAMLPFLLKKLRLDPATASAPFVATLVDVSGLIIYFTVASLLLSGSLL